MTLVYACIAPHGSEAIQQLASKATMKKFQTTRDGLWQMTILAGIADKIALRAQLVCYDVPTYFGMICASFQIDS
jgi:hypothetical protein